MNKRTHFITKFIQELSSDLSCKVKGLNACVGGTFSHAIFVCKCGKAVEYLQRKDILHGEHSWNCFYFLTFQHKTNMSALAKINFVQFTWITILRWCKYGCCKMHLLHKFTGNFMKKNLFSFEYMKEKDISKKDLRYLLF